ncbi:MAG: glycosyltransferase family 39 protein [Thermodesulfobacteriota bacterium]
MEPVENQQKSTPTSRPLLAAAVLLLLVHLVLVVQAARSTSPTFDEIVHITGGYSSITLGDCRFVDVSGLADRAAALPLLFMKLRFPGPESENYRDGRQIETSREFFYGSGNDPESMLFASRLFMAVTGLLAGLAVFLWSKRLFGNRGALVSLAVFSFSPLMLAHNGLATSDTYASILLLASTGLLWRLLHRCGFGVLVLSGLSLGLLSVTKMSGATIVPVALALAMVRLAAGRPWTVKLGKERLITNRAGQAGFLLVLAVFLALFVWAFIWGFYGFRYSAFAQQENNKDEVRALWQEELAEGGAARAAVSCAWDHHLLPEGYVWMLAQVWRNVQQRKAFAAGKYSMRGWLWFFPFCFAVKTPLALMALLLLSFLALAARSRVPCLAYRLAPLAALFFIYILYAVFSHLNIGQRHLMPAYLVLFILAGAAAGVTGRLARPALVSSFLLAALVAAESLWVYPYFLGFFNAAAGGPKKGYRLLVDSSLDWGQDLPALSRYLAQRGREQEEGPAYLSYFGTAVPSAYGLSVRVLPGYWPLGHSDELALDPLEPGTYCISATQLWQVYMEPMGRWCGPYERAYQQAARFRDMVMSASGDPERLAELSRAVGGRETLENNLRLYAVLRLARLCAALRQREPDARAGFSILIYRVGREELSAALSGPPPELFPDPGIAE